MYTATDIKHKKTSDITLGYYYDSVAKIFDIKLAIINLRVCYYKYLGVIIDQRLKWQQQIENFIKKLDT